MDGGEKLGKVARPANAKMSRGHVEGLHCNVWYRAQPEALAPFSRLDQPWPRSCLA